MKNINIEQMTICQRLASVAIFALVSLGMIGCQASPSALGPQRHGATIWQSGSTNTLPTRIVIGSNGSGTAYVKRRIEFRFPSSSPILVRILRLLARSGPPTYVLRHWEECSIPASFTITMRILYRRTLSTDLMCLPADPSIGLKLLAGLSGCVSPVFLRGIAQRTPGYAYYHQKYEKASHCVGRSLED